MTTYNIGYFDRSRGNNEFVVIAQTYCELHAYAIEEKFAEVFKHSSLSERLAVLTDYELPKDFRFSV